MSKFLSILLALCGSLILAVTLVNAADNHGPSKGAKGIAGALGVFSYQPDDWKDGQLTYWTDTDGVDPGTAGCHVGTDKAGKANGRMFGEACTTPTVLVESNPGADIVHPHKNDTGHPDKFDCDA